MTIEKEQTDGSQMPSIEEIVHELLLGRRTERNDGRAAAAGNINSVSGSSAEIIAVTAKDLVRGVFESVCGNSVIVFPRVVHIQFP